MISEDQTTKAQPPTTSFVPNAKEDVVTAQSMGQGIENNGVSGDNVATAQVVKEDDGSNHCSHGASIYFSRWRGVPGQGPLDRPAWFKIAVAWLGAFLGIGLAGGLWELMIAQYGIDSDPAAYTMLAGSFGAQAILLYGVPSAPLSQPRNVIIGQILSTFAGIFARQYIGIPMGTGVVAMPFGVSSALVLMMTFSAIHPPAGGTALIASIGSPLIDELGWGFFAPVMLSTAILLGVSLVVNNFFEHARYPQYWFVKIEKPAKTPPTKPLPV